MNNKRHEKEPPKAVNEWGWQFHHIGIPCADMIEGERYIPHLKMFVSGFETSPFGVEWIRFEDDASFPELIMTKPHLAFVVKNIDEEVREHGLSILIPSNTPSKGIKVAMIEHNGAPIELMEFSENKNLTQLP